MFLSINPLSQWSQSILFFSVKLAAASLVSGLSAVFYFNWVHPHPILISDICLASDNKYRSYTACIQNSQYLSYDSDRPFLMLSLAPRTTLVGYA